HSTIRTVVSGIFRRVQYGRGIEKGVIKVQQLSSTSDYYFASRSFLKNAFESKTSDLAFFSHRRITFGSTSAASRNMASAARYLPTGLRPASSNACPFQNRRLTDLAVAL